MEKLAEPSFTGGSFTGGGMNNGKICKPVVLLPTVYTYPDAAAIPWLPDVTIRSTNLGDAGLRTSIILTPGCASALVGMPDK